MTTNPDRATGWWVLAGVLLTLAGILDIIFGFAAVADSHYYAPNATLIATNLNVYGWFVVVIGLVQLAAGLSLFKGGGFGRWVGIISAGLAGIYYLLIIPAAPFLALAMFVLMVTIIFQLAKPSEGY
jgi:uncharacterized membrane protein